MSEPPTQGDGGPEQDGVAELQDLAEGTLYSVVRYDTNDFEPLYVSDETRAVYPDDEAMEAHFQQIHDYVNIDFMEQDLFSEDLLPAAGEVNYMTTAMDGLKIVRVYKGHEGIFLALVPEEAVVPLVETVERRLL